MGCEDGTMVQKRIYFFGFFRFLKNYFFGFFRFLKNYFFGKFLFLYFYDKKLSQAVRCSLENFGQFDYVDPKADNAVRHVTIVPLYAISQMKE